jgi:hypothetical protein
MVSQRSTASLQTSSTGPARELLGQGRGRDGEHVAHDLEVQRLLRAEVVVDQPAAHAGAVGDVLRGHRGERAVGEQPAGDREDLAAAVLGSQAAVARGRRGHARRILALVGSPPTTDWPSSRRRLRSMTGR